MDKKLLLATVASAMVGFSGAARADNLPGASAKAPPPLTLETHLQDGHAWKLVQAGFPDILRAHLKQVSAASSGRYGKRMTVTVHAPTPDGRFLSASCDKPPRPCPAAAQGLERRVLAATLLRALPTGYPPEALYNLDTFEVRDRGRWALEVAQKKYPDLWQRTRALAAGGSRQVPAPPPIGAAGPVEPE